MMRLDNALSGIGTLGFDTAPLIYFVERHPRYVEMMRAVIQRVDTGALAGYSSVVTLTEVLTLPKRQGNAAMEQAYRDVLLHSRHFTLLPIDVAIAEQAVALRAYYTLRTPDALQIATALHAGCQAFLTNDIALKRVTSLRILILDELEL
jgi:predicted nucleic acid-binding protein